MASFEVIAKETAKVSEFTEAYDFEVYDIVETIKLVGKLRPLLYLSVTLYLAGIYFGQKWMKNRPAFKLDKALFLWNVSLSIFSIVATYRAFPEVAHHLSKPEGLYSAVCSDNAFRIIRKDHNYATAFWAFLFLISKVLEFGDTAFIVLRKQKLIVLHWFHHIATLVLCWTGYEYYDAIGRLFLLNTFVHSIMYAYYALRALKFKIPRKLSMALTSLQIFQMFLYLFINGYSFYKMGQGLPCTRHENVIYTFAFVVFSFAVLFINFFAHSYLMRRQKPKSQRVMFIIEDNNCFKSE